MGMIKFVASNYFSIRANINTACEKNFSPIWYQKLQKKIKLHVYFIRKKFIRK